MLCLVCVHFKLRHVCDDACGALSAAAASAGSLRAARGSGGAALCGTAHTPHRPRGRPAATARVGPQRPHRGGRGRAGPPGGLAHGPWRVRWAGMARLGLRGLADACRVLTGARYMTLFFDRGRRSSGSADRPNSTFRPNWRGVNQRAPYKPLAQRGKMSVFMLPKAIFMRKSTAAPATVPEGFWRAPGGL